MGQEKEKESIERGVINSTGELSWDVQFQKLDLITLPSYHECRAEPGTGADSRILPPPRNYQLSGDSQIRDSQRTDTTGRRQMTTL